MTLYFAVSGIMGIFISRPIDRYGARPVIVIGSICFGLALMLLSSIKTVTHLYAVYIFMSVGWAAISIIPVSTLITNWFVRRRGFAMSITMMGLSLGGVVMVPFATHLVSQWGLRFVLFILGVLLWMVVIPLSLLVFKQRPSDIGQYPDGLPPDMASGNGSEPPVYFATQMREWTRRRAMKTLSFWSIVVAFFLVMTGQLAYLTHQISFLSQTLGRTGAAAAVSVTSAASILGRLVVGMIADRCEKRYVAMGLFLVQVMAILALISSNHVLILYTGTFVFGLTMGSILMFQTLLVGECFGIVSFATVSGIAGVFVHSASAIGPTIAGIIYDLTEDYRIAFSIFAAMTLFAACVIIFAKPPEQKTISLYHSSD